MKALLCLLVLGATLCVLPRPVAADYQAWSPYRTCVRVCTPPDYFGNQRCWVQCS